MKKILLAFSLSLIGIQSIAQWADNGTNSSTTDLINITPNSPGVELTITQSATTTAEYPTNTSRGDIIQALKSSNNIMEFGVSKKSNDRRAWILSRHSDISGNYGMHYSTLHLQPDIGDNSQYRGVAIGYNAGTHLNNGTHLAVDGKVGIGTASPYYDLEVTGSIGAAGSRFNIAQGVINQNSTIENWGSASDGGGFVFNHDGRSLPTGVNQEFFRDLSIYNGKGGIIGFFDGSSGNVGIGTTSATEKLSIENGNIKIDNVDGKGIKIYQGDSHRFGQLILLQGSGTGNGTPNTLLLEAGNTYGTSFGQRILFKTAGTDRFVIEHDGNVGIGTTTPESKLAVNGQIRATEVKVLTDVNSVPDYVFESDYKLRTLKETKDYIAENKHLPEIPSAAEIGENGIDLGDMNMRLLKKIEELTLYQIDLMEKLEKQSSRLLEVEKELQTLKK